MRSLGEFFGHIARGAKADLEKGPAGQRQVLRRDVEERPGQTPDGQKLILRRTTIEEVEVRPPERT